MKAKTKPEEFETKSEAIAFYRNKRKVAGTHVDITCKHCKGFISIRNPKGYCDHLYYPENCEHCKGLESERIKKQRIQEDCHCHGPCCGNSKVNKCRHKDCYNCQPDEQSMQKSSDLLKPTHNDISLDISMLVAEMITNKSYKCNKAGSYCVDPIVEYVKKREAKAKKGAIKKIKKFIEEYPARGLCSDDCNGAAYFQEIILPGALEEIK